MESHRAECVVETLRSELEETLNYEPDDPHLTAAVTGVTHTADGCEARIRLLVAVYEEEADRTLKVIENEKGYARRHVAGRLDIFRDLRFQPDRSPKLRQKAGQALWRLRMTKARDLEPAEKNPSQ